MSDAAIHALSGGLAGITAMAITYPLVNISTRLAVDDAEQSKEQIWSRLRRSLKEEGLSCLFAGLESSLLAISITNVVFYASYEQAKRFALSSRSLRGQPQLSLSTVDSMLASLAAGSFTTLLVNPIWIINTRQTIASKSVPSDSASLNHRPQRLSFIKTLELILRSEGIHGLFRGLKPALMLVLNPVLQYTLFEQLRNWLIARKKARGARRLGDLDFFMLGAISKLFATGITYPYVLLRSRQHVNQTQGKGEASTFSALLNIIKSEGFAGMYKGAQFKLVQSVLTSAILFASKERFYQISLAATKRMASAKR